MKLNLPERECQACGALYRSDDPKHTCCTKCWRFGVLCSWQRQCERGLAGPRTALNEER
jgi:hypothetical protein